VKHWRDLDDVERGRLISEHILGVPTKYHNDTKFALLESVLACMEQKDCPFIRVSWMYPRENPGTKKFVAKFWCRELKSETWGFSDNIADACFEAAVFAALGRLNLG